MADEPEKSNLDAVLSRLERDWRELAQLVRGAASGVPVLEAEAFLLKDGAGRARGEWRLTAEGGATLMLSDPQGRSRAQLGLNDRGGAYLTLRDEFGAIIFQAPDPPRAPGAPGKGEARPGLEAALASRLEQVAQDLAALGELARSREQAPAPAPPVAPPAAPLPLPDRLARFLGAGALALALLTLAGLGLVLNRVPWQGGPVIAPAFVLKGTQGAALARLDAPEGRARLDFLDQGGKVQATLGLDPRGAPGLTLYGRGQKPQAQLSLGPEGEAALSLSDEAGQLRAALGNVGPLNLGPEAALERPTSSLTLWDDKGRVIWLTPRRWRP